MATGTVATHIILDEKGRPWIDGTNTKVIEVVLDQIAYGWDAAEIHRQHPHLPLSKIHAALSYYYDHQSEMDAVIAEEIGSVDAMREAAGESPLVQHLRAAGKLR